MPSCIHIPPPYLPLQEAMSPSVAGRNGAEEFLAQFIKLFMPFFLVLIMLSFLL